MSAKIKRSVAVALMVAFDFPKAGTWDDEKLVSKLAQVPEKVAPEDVPDEFKDMYQVLADSKGQIELVDDGAKSDKVEKSEKPAKAEKASKSEKKDKPTKSKAKKAESDDDEGGVEKDAFGSRVGSMAAKINAGVTKDFADVEQLAKDTGVEVDRILSHLRWGSKEGHFEVKKVVMVKLAKK